MKAKSSQKPKSTSKARKLNREFVLKRLPVAENDNQAMGFNQMNLVPFLCPSRINVVIFAESFAVLDKVENVRLLLLPTTNI